MRLTILTQYYPPEMGAPQSRLFELSEGLKRLGWEVAVVTAMPNYPTGKIAQDYQGRLVCQEQQSGTPVRRYWLYASNSRRALPRIVSMLSFSATALLSLATLRKFRPHYLLVESPPLTLGLSGWLLAKGCGAKLIVNVSDLWPLSAKELGALKEGWLYRRLEALESFLYRKADVCTGQSEQIVRYIGQRQPRQTWLFRNGVDVSRFEAHKPDPSRRNCLVYAGLLGVAQGILSICEYVNFKSLGAEFHIYGSGAEQQAIEAFLRQHPEVGIRYMGTADRDAVPGLLSSYGGALIPLVKNIYGAVPSKIYEAMAAGLPILFSGSGEGAEIVTTRKAGWTNEPTDWTALSSNIKLFLAMSEDKHNDQRRHNREIATSQFDRREQIRKLSDHLQQQQP